MSIEEVFNIIERKERLKQMLQQQFGEDNRPYESQEDFRSNGASTIHHYTNVYPTKNSYSPTNPASPNSEQQNETPDNTTNNGNEQYTTQNASNTLTNFFDTLNMPSSDNSDHDQNLLTPSTSPLKQHEYKCFIPKQISLPSLSNIIIPPPTPTAASISEDGKEIHNTF